jgi:hypothetical protein
VTDLSCGQFVEEVTDLLHGTLDAATQRRLADHMLSRGGCDRYLDQLRRTIRALGDLPAQDLPAPIRDPLLTALRNRPG